MNSNEENDVLSRPLPLRRSASMDVGIASYHLKRSGPEEKLISMVSYYDEAAEVLRIRECKIVRFIKNNPSSSNPYSDMHNAYLIALASCYGLIKVVKAIVENNSNSINCLPVRVVEKEEGLKRIEGETPLDEAVAFRQKEVAQYLYAQGATLKKVSQESLNALLFPPKKRKRS